MKKRTAITYAAGILTGLALAGPASAAVRQLTATPSTQSFYVDGTRTQFEAYAIGGANYVKLRDIGKAVDFGVTYDAATNSVFIDTNAHYEQEAAKSAPATPTPSAPTEESAYNAIMALKEKYPHGTLYGSPYTPLVRLYGNNDKCAGWAMKCSDAAFGNLPYRTIQNPSWDQIRVGDIIEFRNTPAGHAVVVLKKTDSCIEVTESGGHNKAFWGGQYFRWWLEEQPGYMLRTRYPA